MKRVLSLLALFLIPLLAVSQCDVLIEPGSVVVTDQGKGVMFEFQVTNNSNSIWYGDDVKMYWSLNTSAQIMSIQLSNANPSGLQPLNPGESMTFKTPYIDFPKLPSWFPSNPTNSNPWVESMEWPLYTLSFPFNGSWSPINLRLASCSLANGAWVYSSSGQPYYGSFNSNCKDDNQDLFCDCDLELISYDPETAEISIAINSSINCGCNYITDDNYGSCYVLSGSPSNNQTVKSISFGVHVQGLNENWLPCMTGLYHNGWAFHYPITDFLGWETGDTINTSLNPSSCWTDVQDLAPASSCLETVIWQINSSQTASLDDFPGEGWALTCGTCSNSTHKYPDIDISNNVAAWCLDIQDIYGCTDPEAENYYGLATVDDGTCQYVTITDLALDTVLYEVGCDSGGSYWSPTLYLTNLGTEPITEFCVKMQILGQTNDTLCFDTFTILPGETYELALANIYGWGVLSAHVLHVNGVNPGWWIQFGEDDNVGNNMLTQIINDAPECLSPDAVPFSKNEQYDCLNGELVIMNDVLIRNMGNDTLFTYCIQIPELNYDQCFNGYVETQYWIEPGAGQLITNIPPIPADLDFITIIVYNAAGELTEDTYNNTKQINLSVAGQPEACVDVEYIQATANLGCDSSTPFFMPVLEFVNTGLDPITNICVSLDLFSTTYDNQVCWSGNLMPGSSVYIEFPEILTSVAGGWVTVDAVNGSSFDFAPVAIVGLFDQWLNQAGDLCDVFGCTDPQANNYNPNADVDDGTCTYDIMGCTDPAANNYNSNANIDDASCTYDVFGCTDPQANNYNSNANVDDGTCTYDIFGCTDPIANNFNSLATVDDGSCTYDIYGCTDPNANNYDPSANIDDDSCQYNVYGCTDPTAINYDPLANVDDGTCIYGLAVLKYIDGECTVHCDQSGPYYFVTATFRNVGNVIITDFCAKWNVIGGEEIIECFDGVLQPGGITTLEYGPIYSNGTEIIIYLQELNGSAPDPQMTFYETLFCMDEAIAQCVYGCMDPNANNFNQDADFDDGSCQYTILGCTDTNALNFNPSANTDDGSCQYNVLGCTDPNALNFNPFANLDNGSCLYYDPCDDDAIPVYVPNVFTPNGDGINDVWQIITVSNCWLEWDIKIFNRWGNMIYQMTSPDQVWDGKTMGSDRLVSDGVYVCRIIARGPNARVFETITNITIFK
jgi:gliding motility-associated-like protein